MGRILRVDMSRQSIRWEECPSRWAHLGGRGLSAAILSEEVTPTCHPLGRDNKLVLAPGLLAGSSAPTSGRICAGGKSPLTGTIKEANAGGTAAQLLARLGIKAIIFEGEPGQATLHLLHVAREEARLIPAGDYRGLGNYELSARLHREHGPDVAILSIGPAGEMRMSAATIAVTDRDGNPSRHAARGGLGAVMGAKGVKAIVVDAGGASLPRAQDPAAFASEVREFTRVMKEDPRTVNLAKYGTAGVISYVNRPEIASMPTRNHRAGVFARAGEISGQRIAAMAPERNIEMHACMAGCPIRCAIIFRDARRNVVTSALEFETLAMLGSNLEIADLDAIARMDRMCDDIGIDTIEIGNALGVAMDAGVLPFGNAERAEEALRAIGEGTTLGRVLGQGTVVTARVFGVARVPAVKGQGIPAWEPRTLKGIGVTYATSPMGADHTAAMAVMKGLNGESAVAASRDLQVLVALQDTCGLCIFSNAPAEVIARMLNGWMGSTYTGQDVLELGRWVLGQEIAFNRRAGISEAEDRLPSYLYEEALRVPSGNAVFDVRLPRSAEEALGL